MSEILAYAVYTGMDGEDERQEFLHVISALDKIWLEDAQKRRAQDMKRQNAAAESKARRGARR